MKMEIILEGIAQTEKKFSVILQAEMGQLFLVVNVCKPPRTVKVSTNILFWTFTTK